MHGLRPAVNGAGDVMIAESSMRRPQRTIATIEGVSLQARVLLRLDVA